MSQKVGRKEFGNNSSHYNIPEIYEEILHRVLSRTVGMLQKLMNREVYDIYLSQTPTISTNKTPQQSWRVFSGVISGGCPSITSHTNINFPWSCGFALMVWTNSAIARRIKSEWLIWYLSQMVVISSLRTSGTHGWFVYPLDYAWFWVILRLPHPPFCW